MRQTRLRLLGGILAGILFLGGCATGEAASPVATEPAEHQGNIVSAEGVVQPHKKADLAFQVAGRVEQVLVEEGQQVSTGDELLRLDTRDLEQNVLKAKAARASAQASLAKAQAGSRSEEITAAEAALMSAQASKKTAELSVDIAAGNVTSAEGALADAQAGVSSAEQAINIARGNYAAAQATLTSAQAQLAKLQAGATVEERAIAKLQIDRAKDSLWAYQNQRDAIGGYDDKSAEYTLARGNVAIAETDVQIAQIQYDQMLKGARTEDLTMAQADVSQAQAAVSTQSAQVAQAKAALDSAKAGVTQAEANLIIAKAQLEQRKADVDSAAAAVQQAQAQLDLLKAGTRPEDLAVAEAAVAQAEAVLSEAQNALDDAVLQAPFDGTVGELLVEQGELVVPQATVVRFGDLTVMEVETTDLSEVDIDQVQVGQKATVSIDALDGKEFAGTVASIGTIAGASRGDTVYRVVIDLGGADISQLRWGMSAFVEITVR